ncbi:hypothetical protein HYALB_00003020 [Hymenoscyphus albidus]|uniref:Replication protein A C-terminal domain-containing protein n=1 Tax=Hymenoscyphus albidus TaxID=595503 RepID=A0A9N9M250_9HELO|nr:hypothetical protein HYALB_00003020 [Hymenoscyphus albidus]
MANYGYTGANYSTTSYGGQGGNDGGGFMSGSQQGSQDSPGQKSYGSETLRAVTIKQIIESTQAHADAEFKIDGAEVHQITFVGQVNSVNQRAANILWKVDDGTGITEVTQWLNSDMDSGDVQLVANEGDYIRVFGRMKSFANKRTVASNSIRKVDDYNEVSCHLLEATAMHLYFTRGPPESEGGVKAEQGTGMFVDSYGGNNAAVSGGGGKKLPAKTSMVGRRVFELLQNSPQNNEGMHVHHIANQLGIQPNDVFKAGDELLGEGLIYTTVDDETWAVLEY